MQRSQKKVEIFIKKDKFLKGQLERGKENYGCGLKSSYLHTTGVNLTTGIKCNMMRRGSNQNF